MDISAVLDRQITVRHTGTRNINLTTGRLNCFQKLLRVKVYGTEGRLT